MEVFVLSFLFMIIIMLDNSQSERRIINGENIIGPPKRYMAYIVKAPASPRQYDAWLCGGAIVHPLFLISSAACVEDIEFMYAIAGYKKYVPANKIDEDECTKLTKKKVTFTCVPKMYELVHEKVEQWSFIDIAMVRVESPFKFDAPAPSSACSWVPDQIEINFEPKVQNPDQDCMILGWGHKQKWRKPNDIKDYNQPELQFTPTLILDKQLCKNSYQGNPELLPVIDKYMICTSGEGNINSDGHTRNKTPRNADGCDPNQNGGKENDNKNKDCPPAYRSGMPGIPYGNFNYYNFKRRSLSNFTQPTRRNGICQNDHGGPLVTWVGGREVLIGVASVFLVNAQDSSCEGPFLHTSTQCNSAFLNCLLKMFDEAGNLIDKGKQTNDSRRDYETPEMSQARRNREDIMQRYKYMAMMNSGLCDLPPAERGFDMIQRRISWVHHPAGPAENELIEELMERPQIPLNSYHRL